MWDKIVKALSAAVGAVLSFFCGMPPLVWVLLAIMSLDYATGLICGFMGKSPKTETGGVSSRTAFVGLLKKFLVLIVVMVAALVDRAIALGAGIEFAAVTTSPMWPMIAVWVMRPKPRSVSLNRSGRLNALENTLIKNSFDFFDLIDFKGRKHKKRAKKMKEIMEDY